MSQIITACQNWVSDIIVGLNFCPFARREVVNNRIRYQLNDSKKIEKTLHNFVAELQLLNDSDIETTLFILPEGFDDFNRYLDLLELCQIALEEAGFEGVFQIASFHPMYCFDDCEYDDAANYTNRSPYPMLHLIREASMEKVLRHYKDPESIPINNMALARQKGRDEMASLLEACFRPSK